jgi:hypothetical protein
MGFQVDGAFEDAVAGVTIVVQARRHGAIDPGIGVALTFNLRLPFVLNQHVGGFIDFETLTLI